MALKPLISKILSQNGIKETPLLVSRIEKELSLLSNPDSENIKQVFLNNIGFPDKIILEAVDFSDSDYWIKQIMDQLNKK